MSFFNIDNFIIDLKNFVSASFNGFVNLGASHLIIRGANIELTFYSRRIISLIYS